MERYFKELVVAAVLMPDHIHLIINLTGGDSSLGSVVMEVKRCVWLKLRVNKLFNKSIFQRNYYEHIIRNEMDLREKIEYIMVNPMRKGLTESVDEWKWAWHKWME